ncbi:hypothetical protein Syun_031294 [Stephania yunnanensis]|uniref:Uncharacterized protein n=1 Tax=Stephania yunnanensis TaxID=152371 RepID=A0AAP0HF78_9MAGN
MRIGGWQDNRAGEFRARKNITGSVQIDDNDGITRWYFTERDEEAMRLYPDVEYTTVEKYLKRFADMRQRETWEVRGVVSKL